MAARQTITVAWLSRSVPLKLQVAVLPAASLTTNVLVVTPSGNNEPLARPAVCAVLEPGQLSVPSGAVRSTEAPLAMESGFGGSSAGQTITRAWLPRTVTVTLK